MKAIRLFVMLLLVNIIGENVNAQIRHNFFQTMEVYIGGGPSFYFGEIGGRSSINTGVKAIIDNLDIDLWQARVMGTVGVRYSQYEHFAASFELNPIVFSGNDRRSDKATQHQPPYSFTTFAEEAIARAEIYFSNRKINQSPYVIIGAGGMLFGGEQIGDWELCQSYLLGIGQRFPFAEGKAHSIELAYHFTGGKNADNLDGYDKIKKGGSNDLLFTVTYKFNLEVTEKPGR